MSLLLLIGLGAGALAVTTGGRGPQIASVINAMPVIAPLRSTPSGGATNVTPSGGSLNAVPSGGAINATPKGNA